MIHWVEDFESTMCFGGNRLCSSYKRILYRRVYKELLRNYKLEGVVKGASVPCKMSASLWLPALSEPAPHLVSGSSFQRIHMGLLSH